MLTHRNKKPYECKAEGCGKSYCDARSLRRHTENHHSSLVLTTSTTSSQNQSSHMSSSSSSNSMNSATSTITNPSLSPATASGNFSFHQTMIDKSSHSILSQRDFLLIFLPLDNEGDASSPHGATCIQYQINGDGNTITAINSKSPSPSSPTGTNNEGLTRQQLDLISQIMQQTKQANGQKTTVQRPRTWNMQVNVDFNVQACVCWKIKPFRIIIFSTAQIEFRPRFNALVKRSCVAVKIMSYLFMQHAEILLEIG